MAMDETLKLGNIIYIAVKPIFKIYMIIGLGFYLGRKDILDYSTTRHISTVAVRVFIPCLAFKNVVANLNNTMIKEISTIIFAAYFMMLSQGIMVFIVGVLVGCPRNWWGGLIMCGMIPNISDIPIAYLQTLQTADVFSDIDLGTSYVMVYLALQQILQFTVGSYKLVENDFSRLTANVENREFKNAIESSYNKAEVVQSENSTRSFTEEASQKRVSIDGLDYSNSESFENSAASASIEDGDETYIIEHVDFNEFWQSTKHNIKNLRFKSSVRAIANVLKDSLAHPASIMILLSIVIAMIPWVQALFVTSTQYTYPTAPDGQPPLSFIMDFASYLGNAQVPLGLLLLGGTIGRLKVERFPKKLLPVPIAVTFLRLFIFPIIGCAFDARLQKSGLFYGESILYFVSNINWCIPPATSILYLTAVYAPQHIDHHIQTDLLALVYIFQYIFLVICLPFTSSYTLKVALGL